MQLIQANIWDYQNNLDYVCITTNSIVKNDGTLVMGAGNAKQARDKFPQLASSFGSQVKGKGVVGGFYGLLVEGKFIAFQTKYNYVDDSPLELVERSVNMLYKLAHKYPDRTFGLPFPAINNGRRTVDEILPMLQKLPDNVKVYHLNKIG